MSILEVMIAFTLFVTCVVLLMSVWVTHAKGIELGQDQEVAANLCQMFMEQSLQQGFACVPVASQPYIMTRTLRGQSYNAIFNYSVSITNTTVGATAPMHRIVVCNVTWQNSTGNHTVHMESNVAW
jgi:hypothetical protein